MVLATMPRNTSKGRDPALATIRDALTKDYVVEDEVEVESPFGASYELAFVARKRSAPNERIAVAVQHQDAKGTAEQKVAYHLLCLGWLQSQPSLHYSAAFFVASGTGWKHVPTNKLYDPHVVNAKHVKIMLDTQFISAAAAGVL